MELLFTIALSSIILTLTFPVYRDLILKLRLYILTERLTSTLNYARSEAIRRQSVITICKSKNAKRCSGNWRDGWIVLSNKNSTTSLENGELLQVYPALSDGEFLKWHGFRSDDYLQLRAEGSNGQNGSFILCVHSFSKEMIALIRVSQTGRIRIDEKNNPKKACDN
ncbi:MAG: GspH/FimT family pseudopilin [Candidatus Aquirickettsiella sp.]